MAIPNWNEVRISLTDAIAEALPLQLSRVGSDRVAGIGLNIDAYYGGAGLYLLPESALSNIEADAVDNIGDWAISTDWDLEDDHSRAFSRHWSAWDSWFHSNLETASDHETELIFRGLLRTACEAVQAIETMGLLAGFPRTPGFKIMIAEHDEPDTMCVERYPLFVATGEIRIWGEDANATDSAHEQREAEMNND